MACLTEHPGWQSWLQGIRQKQRASGPVMDLHVHPLKDSLPGIQDAVDDAQQLLAAARRFGISHLCISSLGVGYPLQPEPQEYRDANDYVLRMRDFAPDSILPFCYVAPDPMDAALWEIDRCLGENGMVGIKLWVSRRASDPVLDPIIERAQRYQVPVLQHAWLKTTGNLPQESTPADIAASARRHTGAKLIMAHLYGANPRGLEAIRELPNVVVDTSGGDPEYGMLELAVARIGAERVVFGSDAPGRHFGISLAKVLGAKLPEEVKNAILWNNAVRVLPDWLNLPFMTGVA